MDRKATTKLLSRLFEENLNPHNDPRIYWAKEVTFDYGTEHSVRVDYMRFKPVNNTVSGIEKGDFYCYEIKSSVEDFHSKNGHNFIGDYNYYIMPLEVYEKIKDEIPYRVGVLVPYDSTLKSIKAGKRTDRKRPALEMLLMMFRSANRDRRLTMAEIRTINIGKEFIVKFGECETNVPDETIAAVCKDLPIYIEQAIRDKIVENGEISVAPVRHGHWIRPDVPNTRSYKWQCSECGQIAYWLHYGNRGNKNIICKYSYCPDCGAKMDGDTK